jgi:hypothetical protein
MDQNILSKYIDSIKLIEIGQKKLTPTETIHPDQINTKVNVKISLKDDTQNFGILTNQKTSNLKIILANFMEMNILEIKNSKFFSNSFFYVKIKI